VDFGNSAINAQSLAPIALFVRDYDEAMAWFTGVLGFKPRLGQVSARAGETLVLVAPPARGENAATLLACAATPGAGGLHRQLEEVSPGS
jgi:catechol 2,3-dioxygenase-like lactoylglutathione lyase family enzyme